MARKRPSRHAKKLNRSGWIYLVRGVVFLILLIVLAKHRRNKRAGVHVAAWDADGKPLSLEQMNAAGLFDRDALAAAKVAAAAAADGATGAAEDLGAARAGSAEAVADAAPPRPPASEL